MTLLVVEVVVLMANVSQIQLSVYSVTELPGRSYVLLLKKHPVGKPEWSFKNREEFKMVAFFALVACIWLLIL